MNLQKAVLLQSLCFMIKQISRILCTHNNITILTGNWNIIVCIWKSVHKDGWGGLFMVKWLFC